MECPFVINDGGTLFFCVILLPLCIFLYLCTMNILRRYYVWLRRLNHICGFGIQSPTDYWFVRYVVNERWPYYAYSFLTDNDWLTQKLGRLYFRLANWRQPAYMLIDDFHKYWKTGSQKIRFVSTLNKIELGRITIEEIEKSLEILNQCDTQSVLVIEGIYRNPELWAAIINDERVGTSYDLYYCGILLFDKRPYHHHYVINF